MEIKRTRTKTTTFDAQAVDRFLAALVGNDERLHAMPHRYHCPKCHALLNPNVRVVMIAHYNGMRGIVLMSSQLGDYQVICDMGLCRAIGQGELLLTPLQLALMTAEVANGGRPLRPHVVQAVAGARDAESVATRVITSDIDNFRARSRTQRGESA